MPSVERCTGVWPSSRGPPRLEQGPVSSWCRVVIDGQSRQQASQCRANAVPMPCQWRREAAPDTELKASAARSRDQITTEGRQAKPRQDVLARTHARCSQSDPRAYADRVSGHRERPHGQQRETGPRVQAPIRRRLACPGRGSPSTQPAEHSRCAPTVPPSVPRACPDRSWASMRPV